MATTSNGSDFKCLDDGAAIGGSYCAFKTSAHAVQEGAFTLRRRSHAMVWKYAKGTHTSGESPGIFKRNVRGSTYTFASSDSFHCISAMLLVWALTKDQ